MYFMTYELLNIDVRDVNFKRKKCFIYVYVNIKGEIKLHVVILLSILIIKKNLFFYVFKQYYELDTLNILCI
jgi:hypothetical protein